MKTARQPQRKRRLNHKHFLDAIVFVEELYPMMVIDGSTLIYNVIGPQQFDVTFDHGLYNNEPQS